MAEFSTVAVLGAGVLGSQIAFQTAYKGFDVTSYDINQQALDAAYGVLYLGWPAVLLIWLRDVDSTVDLHWTVLVFAVAWTYAHIAYAWPWKERSTGNACTGKYYLTPYDKQRSFSLGTLADGRAIYMGSRGEVSMGRDVASVCLGAGRG